MEEDDLYDEFDVDDFVEDVENDADWIDDAEWIFGDEDDE